ncbi:MAG: HAD family hydrolase [Planctomycetota bacterium]|jgi:HAD superfamily hydrolase (TIGR01509 family)
MTPPPPESPAPHREPPLPVAGLLFDLDGTLVDTEHLHYASTLEVLKRWDCSLSEEEFTRFDLPLSPMELAGHRTEEYVGLLHRTSIDPLPGVLDLLTTARGKGLPMAVASSAPQDQIQASLRAAGLTDLLPVFYSGHEDVEDGRGKPMPDVYLVAAKGIRVQASDCIAVEDSGVGIRAALAAGCFTICIPCASHPTSESSLADRTFTRMDALLELLV